MSYKHCNCHIANLEFCVNEREKLVQMDYVEQKFECVLTDYTKSDSESEDIDGLVESEHSDFYKEGIADKRNTDSLHH